MKVASFLILGAFLILGYQNCSKSGVSRVTGSAGPPPIGELENGEIPNSNQQDCADLTTAAVQPVVLWDWQVEIDKAPVEDQFKTFDQTMSSPVVGDVDGDGLPEVVTTMFSRLREDWLLGTAQARHAQNGVLRVIDGSTGETQFSIGGDLDQTASTDIAPIGHTSPLLVDLDGNGSKEIVYLQYLRQTAVAINGDGSLRWTLPLGLTMDSCQSGFSALQVDQGGEEVIIGNRIFGENSAGIPVVKNTIAGASATSCRAYGISVDPSNPQVQIVALNGLYRQDGTKVVDLDSTGFHSVADVRADIPGLEIVTIANGVISMVSGIDGTSLFSNDLNANQALKCPNRPTVGGGPATIGNFDLDPATIEVATATGRYLTILNDKGELIDQFETQDCSSQKTGITSFDFNGDLRPEILYTDEEYMRVFEIREGKLTEVFKIVNPSGTLLEYPVVADVDGNATAEIVMVANNYPAIRPTSRWYTDPGEEADKAEGMATTGIRVFEPMVKGSWAKTRSSWHQYWFSYTMLDDENKVLASTLVDGTERSFNRNKQGGIFKPICYPE